MCAVLMFSVVCIWCRMSTLKKPQRKRKHRPGLGEEGMSEEKIGEHKESNDCKSKRVGGDKESGMGKPAAADSKGKGAAAKAGGGKEAKGKGKEAWKEADKRGGVSTVPLFDVQKRQKKQQMISQSKRKHAAAAK